MGLCGNLSSVPYILPVTLAGLKIIIRYTEDFVVSVITGPYLARGQRGQLPPPGKLNLFLTSH